MADDAGRPRGAGPASVLWNCESGSGASLGAPLVGCPRERVPTSPLRRKPGRGIAKSDRPRSWEATPGIQPSDRRHMRSEAFWRIAGCDGRWFVVCKLSSSIDVRVRSALGEILVWMVPVHDGLNPERLGFCALEHEKGIRWMPWHQEAMKDVARCEKPRGAASRR